MSSAVFTAQDALVCGNKNPAWVGRVEGNRPRHSWRKPTPGSSAIRRLKQAGAGSGINDVGAARILCDDVCAELRAHSPLETDPGAAAVETAVNSAARTREQSF